ncbi:MAG: FliA/WhiG family RNA polymerase sigma factor [Oscillospiraceae bacterium]
MYTKLEDCDTDALWEEYEKDKSIENRNKIITAYSYLVSTIASKMRGICIGGSDFEDIVNQGFLALIETIDRFDMNRDVKFETFASIRIKGAMIDYIRKQDLIPRRVRKAARDFDEMSTNFWASNNREPTEEEMADMLELPIDKLRKYEAEVHNANIVYFDAFLTGQETGMDTPTDMPIDDMMPEAHFIENEMKQALARAIDSLNRQEKTVISLYYYEGLKLKEIAYVYDITPSRACQIHIRAIEKIKNFLKNNEKIGGEE